MTTLDKYSYYELSQELASRGFAFVIWSWIDVQGRAERREVEITEEQAKEIIRTIHGEHDCNYGITWDTIDYHIDEILIGEQ